MTSDEEILGKFMRTYAWNELNTQQIGIKLMALARQDERTNLNIGCGVHGYLPNKYCVSCRGEWIEKGKQAGREEERKSLFNEVLLKGTVSAVFGQLIGDKILALMLRNQKLMKALDGLVRANSVKVIGKKEVKNIQKAMKIAKKALEETK